MSENPPISNISGIGKLSVELLDSVGITRSSQLARSNAKVLLADLLKANTMLAIRKSPPSLKEVTKWVTNARGVTGIEEGEGEATAEADSLELPPIEEILVAVPIAGKSLAQQGIKASDVPVMEIFSSTEPVPAKVKPAAAVTKKRVESPPLAKPIPEADVAVSKKNPLSLNEKKAEIAPLESSKKNDVRITASAGLNEGRKLHSRRFIRGVLHPQVGRVRLAALVTILMFLMMPVALGSAIMIILTKNLMWVLGPVIFLLLLFLYATIAGGAKCRICGQPLFRPKNCRKHVKAHRLIGLGYIFPTCLHMLFFHWFRCIYCGTSVRLKK